MTTIAVERSPILDLSSLGALPASFGRLYMLLLAQTKKAHIRVKAKQLLSPDFCMVSILGHVVVFVAPGAPPDF